MANCKLADELEQGAKADIFYDAYDFEDKGALKTLEDFHAAIAASATELRKLADIDLSAEIISAKDLATLRDIQARITTGDSNGV